VAEVGDAGRVAVRLSPPNTDAGEPREAGDLEDPDALYAHAIKALDAFGLAYLLLTELRWFGGVDGGKGWDMPFFIPKKFVPQLVQGPHVGLWGLDSDQCEAAARRGPLRRRRVRQVSERDCVTSVLLRQAAMT
jgi:hypothetical protein